MNHTITLPRTVVVDEPMAVEFLHVFASTEPLPQIPVSELWHGYDALTGTASHPACITPFFQEDSQ